MVELACVFGGILIGAYLWNRYGYNMVHSYVETKDRIKARLRSLGE